MSAPSNIKSPENRSLLKVLGAAVLVQGLFASVYWQLICTRAGYETLWWIIAGCGLVLAVRLIQSVKSNIRCNLCISGIICLSLAFLCNASLVILADPWLLAAAFLMLLMSLDFSIRNSEDRRLLAGAALPLAALLLPLFSLDTITNDWIGQTSHYCAEQILRVPGILIANEEIPFRFNNELRLLPLDFSTLPAFGVPFLAAVGLTLIGLNSRRLFHSSLLIAAIGFWAVFAQATYLVMLGACFQLVLIDISPELQSFIVMMVSVLTVGLIVSTDQFLAFWLGPVTEESLESTSDLVNLTGESWNRWLATRSVRKPTRSRTRRTTVPNNYVLVTVAATILLGGLGFLRFLNIEKFDSVQLSSAVDIDTLALKEASELLRYEFRERNSTSDQGARQHRWYTYLDGVQCLYSASQLNGRWAHPAAEQMKRNWTISKITSRAGEKTVEFEKESGERGLLVIQELGGHQGLTSDSLGHFPTWGSPAASEMFLTNRTYLTMFAQYFQPPNPEQFEHMRAQLEQLRLAILE
ncbi:MAG: hypothetical protein MK106_11255 [Mariniblastus sp.]|nr:hypothetical protein [Mariniblastus sp.]